MTRLLLHIACFLLALPLAAQWEISGQVTDRQGAPIPGANISIAGTYEGTTSDSLGQFLLQVENRDSLTLAVSFLGFETARLELSRAGSGQYLRVELREAVNELNAVTISAGAIEAGEKKRAVIFRPLDIATTAGATADITGALNTLPGTQRVGEEGRLFVRGGDARETAIFIDGTATPHFFSGTAPDLPTRSRFSPFLFSGTLFSSGGYSAEYGQALSSALILESRELAEKTESSLSLMSVGLSAAHTQRWEKSSASLELGYTDLSPYTGLVQQNIDWRRAPMGLSGQATFRHRTSKTGMFKAMLNARRNRMAMAYPLSEEVTRSRELALQDDNLYFNAAWSDMLSEDWSLRTGLSLSSQSQQIEQDFSLDQQRLFAHLKSVLTWQATDRIKLKGGAEFQRERLRETYLDQEGETFPTRWVDPYLASFLEADLLFSNKLVGRAGLRAEHSALLQQSLLSPRLSLAWKVAEKAQFSLAWGRFSQRPDEQWLRYTRELPFEQAEHLILNFQLMKNRRTFRVEAYQKTYRDLPRFPQAQPWLATGAGRGHARGLDIFYRDQKTIKFADFWVSYSLLDTRRLYRDFPEAAMPGFASRHNLSVVYKQWIPALEVQMGATYAFSSPRRYDDPNGPNFQEGRTAPFHDLSLNASYLTRLWGHYTIVHASVTNVLGLEQTFGRRFSATPGPDGQFASAAIRPPAPRFIFVGVFISIE